MNAFIAHFRSLITGVLSGFDHLVFRGHLLPLMQPNGMFFFLEASGVRLLDYKEFVRDITKRLKEASLAEANDLERPVRYLDSSAIDKEALAGPPALRLGDPADIGLVQAVSPGEFAVAGFRNRDLRQLIHPAPKNATCCVAHCFTVDCLRCFVMTGRGCPVLRQA